MTETQRCPECRRDKPLSEFAGKHRAYCETCQACRDKKAARDKVLRAKETHEVVPKPKPVTVGQCVRCRDEGKIHAPPLGKACGFHRGR